MNWVQETLSYNIAFNNLSKHNFHLLVVSFKRPETLTIGKLKEFIYKKRNTNTKYMNMKGNIVQIQFKLFGQNSTDNAISVTKRQANKH